MPSAPPPEPPAPPQPEGPPAEAHLGTTLTAYLLSGPLTFGGLGWLADRWLGTSFLVALGALVGVGLSVYTIWLRYGKP